MKKNINDQDLDSRLSSADPAKRGVAPELSAELLEKATLSSAKLSLAERLQAMSKIAKAALSGGALAGVAGVTALVVVLGSTPAPLIELSAQLGGNRAAGEMSADTGAEDKMWMPYQIFEYQAAENLSKESSAGAVYKLSKVGTPEGVLANVAKVMGVAGSAKKYPDFSEENPGYYFSTAEDPWDYENQVPNVSIWWSGTASWYYSNPNAYPASVCEEEDSEGNCTVWEEFKPTPELLPTREEIVAKAIEVFGATGLDVSAADLRIYSDEWGASASAAFEVAGSKTSIEWYLGWSSNGEISYAGGHSIQAEEVGSYDTISAFDAVERLSDWRWNGSPASSYYEQYQGYGVSPGMLRSDDSVSSEPSEGEAVEVDEPAEPTEEPAPVEPVEPELVKLTVVDSVSTLLTIWDTKGDVWLVPGYLLINDQGWFSAVISLIEGVIALPKETDFDIMPLPADDSPVSDK